MTVVGGALLGGLCAPSALARSTPSRHRHTGPTSFEGSCQFAGTVRFRPPLTNAPQDGRVYATATGNCTGTLTDPRGHVRSLNSEPVRAVAQSSGLESCGAGRGSGSGYLEFRGARLQFTYSEVRAGPVLTLNADGARSGSATAEGNVSPQANPVAILQACSSTGLSHAPIDVRLLTTPSISG
jgi:hypothetical protein